MTNCVKDSGCALRLEPYANARFAVDTLSGVMVVSRYFILMGIQPMFGACIFTNKERTCLHTQVPSEKIPARNG